MTDSTLTVAEIRPSAVMADQGAAVQADIDWLVARRGDFIPVPCPACNAQDSESLYEKFAMPHRRCHRCQTQYVSPRPDQATLAEFYARSVNYAYWAQHVFPASEQPRREKIFRPRARILAQLAEDLDLNNASVLEIGAGYGLFCEEVAALDRIARVIGIEPTPELAQVCRDRGIEVIEGPYESVGPDLQVDLIACFEVIEHLFDPADFLRWCIRRLAPGGGILMTCPNIAGFEPLILGFESGALEHEHLNLFNPASLSLLMQQCGFTNVAVTTPGELDVELVRTALDDGRFDAADLDPAIHHLLTHDDPAVATGLQQLIQQAGLSSNMRVLATKAASS
ncbi:MAG: class I SAM-dependent methyltransferase [Alphaproteobacteria bacterium]